MAIYFIKNSLSFIETHHHFIFYGKKCAVEFLNEERLKSTLTNGQSDWQIREHNIVEFDQTVSILQFRKNIPDFQSRKSTWKS